MNRVVGIGSPHGNDRVGWLLIDRLTQRSDLNATVAALSTPLEMVDDLNGCDCLLIVDVCHTGVPEGSVVRLIWPDHRIQSLHRVSSHGLGIGESLRLAEQLGRLPRRVVLICLEVGDRSEVMNVNEEDIPGLDELESRVLLELQESPFENSTGEG